jgi:hypothetical protein
MRIVRAQELFAHAGHEIGDAPVSELVVPALAAFGHHALRDGVRDFRLIGGALDELDELRFGEAGFFEERRAQAGREVIVAEVAAPQRRPRFVDRARQEHEAREARTRIARRTPAQADRAHRPDGSRQL